MRLITCLIGSILLTCLFAPGVEAGAWPRKQGEGFASVSIRLGWPKEISTWTQIQPTEDYSTLYFEYGVTDRLTVGLDIGHSVGGNGKTVLFAQWPIQQANKRPKIAAQLGLGVIAGNRVIRPGLSLGWGREKGWISIDSVAEAYIDSKRIDMKLDMTLGRNLARDRKLIVQVQTGKPDGRDPFVRLAPSLVLPLRGAVKMETGVTWGLTGDSSMGLKFGLWTDF